MAKLYSISPEHIESWKRKIDDMSQIECARELRFSKPGENPIFVSGELWEYFQAHFKKLGGMTPAISKAIGWGR
jgi:uncharacterized protein YcaQ